MRLDCGSWSSLAVVKEKAEKICKKKKKKLRDLVYLVWFSYVWFLSFMAYQTSFVMWCQICPWRRIVMLFNPLLKQVLWLRLSLNSPGIIFAYVHRLKPNKIDLVADSTTCDVVEYNIHWENPCLITYLWPSLLWRYRIRSLTHKKLILVK